MHLAVFKNNERNGPYIFALRNFFFFFCLVHWGSGREGGGRGDQDALSSLFQV